MNTSDFCPRGRELYDEWWAWKHRKFAQTAMQEYYAYRAHQQHVDECATCKGEVPARPEPVTGPFKKR